LALSGAGRLVHPPNLIARLTAELRQPQLIADRETEHRAA